MSSKPRVVKDYEKLDVETKEQIKLSYPSGFSDYLVTYTDKDGTRRTALPFETDEKYYLIRMTASEAMQIVDDDDDFDSAGMLKDEIKEEYEEKYNDFESMEEVDDSKDSYKDDGDDEYDDGSEEDSEDSERDDDY